MPRRASEAARSRTRKLIESGPRFALPLLIFTRVVENGGFTAASLTLGLSASAVAKAISRLEDELGVRLFHRTTRSLALTTHGQNFYERCARILKDLDEATAQLQEATSRPRGKLRVILPVSFGRVTVVPHLHEFLSRYPEIDLDITLSDDVAQFIEEGFDLAVRTGFAEDSRLKMRVLTEGEHIIVASPSYLQRFGRPQRPDDLRDHECIIGRLGQDWVFTENGSQRKMTVTGRLRIKGGDAYREAAVAGLGIAHATRWLFRKEIERGDLVPILSDFVAGQSPVALYFPAARYQSMIVRAFIGFLAKISKERA